MQESGNTALAAAIAAEERGFRVLVEVDWGGDNTYSHTYSDLSQIAKSPEVQRDLVGDIPDEVNIVEGHQSAQLTLNLGGTRSGDTLPVHLLLDPYYIDSPLYGVLKLGQRVRYSIITETPAGPVTIRQFTGRVRTTDIRADGTVQMVGADYAELLRKAVSLRPWAIDAAQQRDEYPEHVQIAYQQWPIDRVLRQCGIYQSPPNIEQLIGAVGDGATMFSATLHGAWIAEVGDTGGHLRAIAVPDYAMFVQGQFGLAANGNSSDYSRFDYLTPFATPWPASWTVACGAWIYGPQATVAGSTVILLTTLDAGVATLRLTVSDAGVVTSRLTSTAYDVTRTGPTIGSVGWHYVGVAWTRLGGSGMRATFRLDGADTVTTSATVFPVFGPTGTQDYVILESAMPVQCVQMWVLAAGVTLVWPEDLIESANDLTPGSVLDTGQGLTRIPDLYQVEAWTVLSDIVKGHWGLLHIDEYGTVRFEDRATVRTPPASDDKTITSSELTGCNLTDRADGVRNIYSWKVDQAAAWKQQKVFAADKPEQFDSPPVAVTNFTVGVENAQVIGVHSLSLVNPWPSPDDTVKTGFFPVQRGTATIAPGVTVGITPIDQRTLRIQVFNPNAYWVRFVSPSNQPSLRVQGTVVVDDQTRVGSIQHDGSISSYAERVFEITVDPWRSYYEAVEETANSLLADTRSSIPVIDRIPAIGDPRLQLGDAVVLDDPARLGRMVGIVSGIVRPLDTAGGLKDDLTVRIIHPPGTWVLGDEDYSLLGDTTILG